eukprot:gene18878-25436_t
MELEREAEPPGLLGRSVPPPIAHPPIAIAQPCGKWKRTNKRRGCMQNKGRQTDVKAHAKELCKKKRTNAYRGRIQNRGQRIDIKAHANDLRNKRVAKLEEHVSEQIRNSQQYLSADSYVSSEACKSMSSKKRRSVKFCLGADQKPKKLGSGGFDDVFEGTYMGIKVALKVLKGMDKEQMLESNDFSQEMASLAATAGQSNCVGCEGWFVMEMDGSVEGDELYQSVIVMEMMDESLEDRMEAEKTRIGGYLRILTAAIHGLGQVHESGLFHNDIKGDNILIKGASVDGDGGHNLVVKISDMGLSSSKHTPPHNPGGTPGFMGPGEEDGSVARDAYGLGEMVSRHIDPLLRVAKGSELEVAQIERLRALAKRVKEDRPTTSEILAELEEIAMKKVVMEDEMAMDEGEIPMVEDFDGYSLFYGCGPDGEGPAMVWSAGTNLATPLNSGKFMQLDVSPTASVAADKHRAYTKPSFKGLFASTPLNSWESSEDQSTMSGGTLGGHLSTLVVVVVFVPPPLAFFSSWLFGLEDAALILT